MKLLPIGFKIPGVLVSPKLSQMEFRRTLRGFIATSTRTNTPSSKLFSQFDEIAMVVCLGFCLRYCKIDYFCIFRMAEKGGGKKIKE
jgi:hypothetical protein